MIPKAVNRPPNRGNSTHKILSPFERFSGWYGSKTGADDLWVLPKALRVPSQLVEKQNKHNLFSEASVGSVQLFTE